MKPTTEYSKEQLIQHVIDNWTTDYPLAKIVYIRKIHSGEIDTFTKLEEQFRILQEHNMAYHSGKKKKKKKGK